MEKRDLNGLEFQETPSMKQTQRTSGEWYKVKCSDTKSKSHRACTSALINFSIQEVTWLFDKRFKGARPMMRELPHQDRQIGHVSTETIGVCELS